MIKLIIALTFTVLLLSACSGQTPQAPDTEPSFVVGSVTIISNDVEYEPHEQFEHAGWRTPEGETMSGSAPPPPPLNEFLEMLPKIQYSSDFQVVVDGEYAKRITYLLSEIEEFSRSYSEAIILVEMDELHFPEAEGTYILVVRVIWSDSDSLANYVHLSYTSKITK
jgi:hypothetical protein